jgi:hypothetical protein
MSEPPATAPRDPLSLNSSLRRSIDALRRRRSEEDVPAAEHQETEEMKRQVAPEAVLDAIEESATP